MIMIVTKSLKRMDCYSSSFLSGALQFIDINQLHLHGSGESYVKGESRVLIFGVWIEHKILVADTILAIYIFIVE